MRPNVLPGAYANMILPAARPPDARNDVRAVGKPGFAVIHTYRSGRTTRTSWTKAVTE